MKEIRRENGGVKDHLPTFQGLSESEGRPAIAAALYRRRVLYYGEGSDALEVFVDRRHSVSGVN
jgi:hypothetical protein